MRGKSVWLHETGALDDGCSLSTRASLTGVSVAKPFAARGQAWREAKTGRSAAKYPIQSTGAVCDSSGRDNEISVTSLACSCKFCSLAWITRF